MTLQRKWTRKTSLKIVTGTKAVLVSVSVAILCLCLVIGHLLEENRWINESITATIIGSIAGTVILFQVKKKRFFQNFITILPISLLNAVVSSDCNLAWHVTTFPNPMPEHGRPGRDSYCARGIE
ncbi:hypothetical protein V6N13_049563 [Hibiscus sabdariffa]